MDIKIDKLILKQQADRLCRERGVELVFLTVFGADLYGTVRRGESDLDLRGLFLPTLEFPGSGDGSKEHTLYHRPS